MMSTLGSILTSATRARDLLDELSGHVSLEGESSADTLAEHLDQLRRDLRGLRDDLAALLPPGTRSVEVLTDDGPYADVLAWTGDPAAGLKAVTILNTLPAAQAHALTRHLSSVLPESAARLTPGHTPPAGDPS